MKITLIISSLGSGGAERVITGMANWWAKHGHHVTIITYSNTEDFYWLDDSVRRMKLNLLQNSRNLVDSARNLLRRILRLREAIKSTEPDVVISFLDKTNILTLISCLGLNYKIYVSERTNPLYLPIGNAWSFLRKTMYKHAKGLVVQTDSIVDWAERHTNSESIFVIPNALDEVRLRQIQQASNVAIELPWKHRIITMGRLSREKGHDLLLRSCAKLFTKYPDWGLEIIGDGVLRDQLVLLAQELGISERVKFYGQIQNPFGYIKSADIFAFPSRVEGFPNALLEAMALGKAVVSFDCPSGPSDLIKHGENGMLVQPENIEQFSAALGLLMVSSAERNRLGYAAQDVKEKFSEMNVMKLWDKMVAR